VGDGCGELLEGVEGVEESDEGPLRGTSVEVGELKLGLVEEVCDGDRSIKVGKSGVGEIGVKDKGETGAGEIGVRDEGETGAGELGLREEGEGGEVDVEGALVDDEVGVDEMGAPLDERDEVGVVEEMGDDEDVVEIGVDPEGVDGIGPRAYQKKISIIDGL